MTGLLEAILTLRLGCGISNYIAIMCNHVIHNSIHLPMVCLISSYHSQVVCFAKYFGPIIFHTFEQSSCIHTHMQIHRNAHGCTHTHNWKYMRAAVHIHAPTHTQHTHLYRTIFLIFLCIIFTCF